MSSQAVKRSACDRCRAKRVRCPRTPGSTEPCARCVRAGAACVTGSPGYPGRPRRALVKSSRPVILADISSRGGSILRDSDHSESGTATSAPGEAVTPANWIRADTPSNMLDEFEAADPSKHAALPPKSVLLQGSPESWPGHYGGSLFGFPLSVEGSSITALQQLGAGLHNHELSNGGGGLDMVYTDQELNNILDVGFLNVSESQSPPIPTHRASTTILLMRFEEKLERQISQMEAFLSDPRSIIANCLENSMGMGTENPVAIAITCTEDFVDIIQQLTASNQSASPSSSNGLISSTASSVDQPESFSTETTLLVLSSYLRLMRLYDSLFCDVYRSLSQVSSETIKSLKVKAVFRIGGFSSLQDMSGKVYAQGIVEIIQSHIQTLERCMGLPAAYCLSGEGPASPTGIFAGVDRARLLHAVMTQEDVGSQRGHRSYVESIRDNMSNTVALFEQ